MKPPRYYSPVDHEEFTRYWAGYARDHFGLFAGLDFQRFLEDLLRADAAHALEIRDLARQLEDQP